MMRNLGSNISPHTGQHAAKALAVTDVIYLQLLKATNTSYTKQYQTIPSILKDLLMMQQQLSLVVVSDGASKQYAYRSSG